MFGFLVLMGALPGRTLSHESELRISGFLGLLCHHPFCTFVFSSLSLFLSLVLFCFGPPPVPGQETASSLIPALSVYCDLEPHRHASSVSFSLQLDLWLFLCFLFSITVSVFRFLSCLVLFLLFFPL